MDERRAWPRCPQEVRVFISDPEDVLEEPFPAWIVDCSETGVCLVHSHADIEEGATLMIRPVRGPARKVALRVKNRRVSDALIHMGCEFVPADAPEKAALIGMLMKAATTEPPAARTQK